MNLMTQIEAFEQWIQNEIQNARSGGETPLNTLYSYRNRLKKNVLPEATIEKKLIEAGYIQIITSDEVLWKNPNTEDAAEDILEQIKKDDDVAWTAHVADQKIFVTEDEFKKIAKEVISSEGQSMIPKLNVMTLEWKNKSVIIIKAEQS